MKFIIVSVNYKQSVTFDRPYQLFCHPGDSRSWPSELQSVSDHSWPAPLVAFATAAIDEV